MGAKNGVYTRVYSVGQKDPAPPIFFNNFRILKNLNSIIWDQILSIWIETFPYIMMIIHFGTVHYLSKDNDILQFLKNMTLLVSK